MPFGKFGTQIIITDKFTISLLALLFLGNAQVPTASYAFPDTCFSLT